MEVDLFHAFFGRFGVLIPVLGLFFEIGAIFTQKDLISKISGTLVILGSVLVIFAFISGVIELKYLISTHEDLGIFKLHIILGSILTFVFLFILTARSYLFFRNNEKLVVIYMLVYTITVMFNLLSNEIILHKMYGS